jgi:ribosomal protein L10
MSIINKKKETVNDLQINFERAKSAIFYNFHNIENREIFELKQKLSNLNAFFKIYKNNLIKKSLEKNFSFSKEELEGANAIIFCNGDEYSPLKVLEKFGKNHPSSFNRLKIGIYNEKKINSGSLVS